MSRKNVFLLALAAVLLAAVAAGCTSSSRSVKTGDNVTIDVIINSSDNTMLQTSYARVAKDLGKYDPAADYTPYRFKVGSPGVVQGVNEAVVGMKVNETKTIVVPPEKAYGQYNRSLILWFNLSMIEASGISPYVNETLVAPNSMTARVDSIDRANNKIYLDFNYPYAGQTLVYQITVRKIE